MAHDDLPPLGPEWDDPAYALDQAVAWLGELADAALNLVGALQSVAEREPIVDKHRRAAADLFLKAGIRRRLLAEARARASGEGPSTRPWSPPRSRRTAMAVSLTREDKLKLVREIRRLRASLGLTQVELAKHVEVDSQTVSRWERETCLPYRLNQIARLQSVLRRLQREERRRSPVAASA